MNLVVKIKVSDSLRVAKAEPIMNSEAALNNSITASK